MMRQLGGSFGVALISTYLTRDIVHHRGNLVTHLNVNDPAVQNHLHAIANGMQARGMPPDVALKTAYRMMDGSVSLQATILSYMDIFMYIGCLFLICVPFILIFIKKAKAKVSLAEAGH
jgi:DHA2 family multidrug resistance protein